MALIHRANLTPTKIELLRTWVPAQPWWVWAGASIESVGAYRFDDPAGEVGIETHLLSTGEEIVQVPLTYRGAPLEAAQSALVGTMEHSVLGHRWVYDGCFDPVYATALATAILTGGTQAELEIESDNGLQRTESTARATGSGKPGSNVPSIDTVTTTSDRTATTMRTGELELVIRRALGGHPIAGEAATLTGVWPGNDEPALLALARLSGYSADTAAQSL